MERGPKLGKDRSQNSVKKNRRQPGRLPPPVSLKNTVKKNSVKTKSKGGFRRGNIRYFGTSKNTPREEEEERAIGVVDNRTSATVVEVHGRRSAPVLECVCVERVGCVKIADGNRIGRHRQPVDSDAADETVVVVVVVVEPDVVLLRELDTVGRQGDHFSLSWTSMKRPPTDIGDIDGEQCGPRRGRWTSTWPSPSSWGCWPA